MFARRSALVVVSFAALSALGATTASNAPRLKTGDLVVFVADSATSKPLRGVNVTARPPGWYWSESHQEPDWWAQTDSTGWAHLEKLPLGLYEVNLCAESYGLDTDVVKIEHELVDTLTTTLVFVPRVPGIRGGCRQCEVRFVIPADLRRGIDRNANRKKHKP